MDNLLKALLLSSFLSNFIATNAMEDDDENYHKAMAASLNISYEVYKEGIQAERQRSTPLQKTTTQNDGYKFTVGLNPKPNEIELPTIIKNNQLSAQFSYGKERETLQHFMRIFEYLKSVPENTNVHGLDTFVVYNMQCLLNVGKLYNMDDPTLKLAEVGKQMSNFVKQNPLSFSNFKYHSTAVSDANILSYLATHFDQMDGEIGSFDGAREVWSRSWTLALKLTDEYKDFKYMQIIFEQAIEDYLTGGGSLGGRINRGLVAYIRLLGSAGVIFFQ